MAGELSEAHWALFASSHLRKVHGSFRTEEQDSVGNSTYTRHDMQLPCCKGDGCQLQQLVAGLCCIFNLVQGPKLFGVHSSVHRTVPRELDTYPYPLSPFLNSHPDHCNLSQGPYLFPIISTPWCLPVMLSSLPFFNIAPF